MWLTVPKTDTGGWIEYIKVYWGNNVEGTRQNDFVTSGEGVLIWIKHQRMSGTEQGGATVYQKHRILRNRKDDVLNLTPARR